MEKFIRKNFNFERFQREPIKFSFGIFLVEIRSKQKEIISIGALFLLYAVLEE